MPLDESYPQDYGNVRGREYVYPISQDILYDPRVGAESGADPVPWRIPIPPRIILPPAQPTQEPLVAHDWGHLARQVAGEFLNIGAVPPPLPTYFTDPTEVGPVERVATAAVSGGLGPDSCEGMVWSGGVPPKGFKVVNFCGQGVLRKVRRRRRRRLLTASDKADISYIVATTGKGQLAASLIHRSAQ